MSRMTTIAPSSVTVAGGRFPDQFGQQGGSGLFNSFSVGPFSTHDHLHLPHKAAGVALSSPKAVTVCEFVVQPQRLEEATDKRDFGEKAILFEFGRPDRIVYNSSADGTLRSIEDSPKCLGIDRLGFVWIHDVCCGG